MAGQLIILPGVKSAASNGSARIDMTTADQIAARMPSLTHSVSARAVTAGAAGISGRCRASGGLLTMIGASPASMTVKTLANRKAIALTSETAAAAVLLPSGSWKASHCTVSAIYVGPGFTASNALHNIITSYNNTVYAGADVRGYGGAEGSVNAGNLISTLAVSGNNAARVPVPAVGAWAILMSALDAATGTAYISINGGAAATQAIASPVVPADESLARMGIGYTTASGLRDGGVGDLFVFDASMQGSTVERAAVSDLITALKAQYGIA